MNRIQRLAHIAEQIADVYEVADDLGAVDALRTWWRSRRIVKKRRARRKQRAAGRD